MDSLAAYGSSDEESDTNESPTPEESTDFDQILPSDGILIPAPSRSYADTHSSAKHEDELDSIVKPRKWEKEEAPKPPGRGKRNAKVLLVLPELHKNDGNDSDDESSRPKAPNIQTSSSEGVKLLSMLPAPKGAGKSSNSSQILVPSFLKRKQPTNPDLRPPKKKTLRNPFTSNEATKPPKEDEDDEKGDVGDFFGLDDPEKEVDSIDSPAEFPAQDEFQVGPSKKPAQVYAPLEDEDFPTTSEPHPSHLYNLAGGVEIDERYGYPVLEEPEQSSGSQKVKPITDEKALNMIYKHEMEQWGHVKPGLADLPDIQDASVDSALGPNVRTNLLKTISSSRPPDAMLAAARGSKAEKESDPGKMAKRKHQITYLAFMAKQREEQLKEQWSQNRFSKRQTQAKYGF